MFSPVSISTCKYLFNQEAEEIFKNCNFHNIDQCLELAMRINVHILSSKNGFFLIDPAANNNQCHLYALRAAQIMRNYDTRSTLARSDENRFLHLSLFLSYPLISESSFFLKAASLATKEMGEIFDENFSTFLMDEKGDRKNAARFSLNRLFEEHIKGVLSSHEEESDLHAELFKVAHDEGLMITKGETRLYTYPKLAGVAYMVDVLAREHIPFILKVKVITKQGSSGPIIVASQPKIDDNTPVVVFEGIATNGPLTRTRMEKFKGCPNHSFRHQRLHKEDKPCFFCKKIEIDLQPYRQRLQNLMRNPNEMFYALGADFMTHKQKGFLGKIFGDHEKYPRLSALFEHTIPKIAELGLGMDNPTTFTVCHVHADSAAHAFSETLMLDTSPEKLLQSRGII